MSGMEALGRLFNVVPIAAGRGLRLNLSSAITFVTTGSDTFTLTSATSFAGSYATPGTITCNVYKTSATNGTAAWVRDNTLISTNTIVTTVTTAFTITGAFIHGSASNSGAMYVKLSAGGAGLVTAILHDLSVQRTPANLPILSA
jgi:hypothetical protein